MLGARREQERARASEWGEGGEEDGEGAAFPEAQGQHPCPCLSQVEKRTQTSRREVGGRGARVGGSAPGRGRGLGSGGREGGKLEPGLPQVPVLPGPGPSVALGRNQGRRAGSSQEGAEARRTWPTCAAGRGWVQVRAGGWEGRPATHPLLSTLTQGQLVGHEVVASWEQGNATLEGPAQRMTCFCQVGMCGPHTRQPWRRSGPAAGGYLWLLPAPTAAGGPSAELFTLPGACPSSVCKQDGCDGEAPVLLCNLQPGLTYVCTQPPTPVHTPHWYKCSYAPGHTSPQVHMPTPMPSPNHMNPGMCPHLGTATPLNTHLGMCLHLCTHPHLGTPAHLNTHLGTHTRAYAHICAPTPEHKPTPGHPHTPVHTSTNLGTYSHTWVSTHLGTRPPPRPPATLWGRPAPRARTVRRRAASTSIMPRSRLWQSGGIKCGMWNTPRFTFSSSCRRLSSSKGRAPCGQPGGGQLGQAGWGEAGVGWRGLGSHH